MSELISRLPEIDWSQGFERHWNGSAATSHPFNALSFMFPQGERYFQDVAIENQKKYANFLSPELTKNVEIFVQQEAAHTHYHRLYNENLESLGYTNVMHGFMVFLEKTSYTYFSSVHRLAIVCAYEHYTAVLGNFLLSNPGVLKLAPQKMALMWGWHAAEESEHKAVCFDLYKSIQGTWLTRIMMFTMVSFHFLIIFTRLYLSMLWKDGAFKLTRIAGTLVQSLSFFWGGAGIGWHILFYGLKYLSPRFHPWDHNNKQLITEWLMKNKSSLRELTAQTSA